MPESRAEGPRRRIKYEVGKEYQNAHRPPGKAPKGTKWELTRRHPEKGYAEDWRLTSIVQDEFPPMIAGTTHAAESARAMEEAEERRDALAQPQTPTEVEPPPQIPYVRGSYTADTDLEDQEREDELREQAVQQAISASRQGPQEEPPSKA